MLLDLRSLEEAASSGNYTLNCEAGSYTYTGKASTLTSTRILTAGAGSYNYTGQDATPTVGRLLTADAGSYVYTGKDATLVKTVPGSYTLSAENGSYLYTGQAASLVYTPIVTSTTKGGWSNYKLTKREKERLARLRMMQSRIQDDEEVLAIILASMIRRH